MEQRKPGKAEILSALVTTAAAVWYMMPRQDRQMIRLRILHLLRRASERLARREGLAGMRDELAGRPPGGRYGAAYALSLARDKLTAAIEAERP